MSNEKMKKSKPILWKVLDENMNSINGGKLHWELGKWHTVKGPLKICKNGLHLTTRPEKWVSDSPSRIFLANAKEIKEWNDDKCVCRKVQLIIEVPQNLWLQFNTKWDALYAEFNTKRDALDAEFNTKRDALDAEFKPKWDALYAEFKPKRDALDAEFNTKRDALDAEFNTKRDALYAEFKPKWDALYAEFKPKRDALDAEFNTKRDALYAELASTILKEAEKCQISKNFV